MAVDRGDCLTSAPVSRLSEMTKVATEEKAVWVSETVYNEVGKALAPTGILTLGHLAPVVKIPTILPRPPIIFVSYYLFSP